MNLVVYRLILFSLLIYTFGLESDMRWHQLNALRADYFILPHIIMYAGIILTLFCFYLLRINGVKVSYYVFFAYPFLSMFDEIWHRVYGIELYTSPMMFWSPAHFSFGIVTSYIWYTLLKMNLETNIYFKTLFQTFFFVAIWKLVRYILVPLSPFSFYPELHTEFNILIPVFLYLFFLTMSRFVQNKNILLISAVLFALIPTSAFDFVTGSEFVFGAPPVLLLTLAPALAISILERYSQYTYLFYGLFITNLIILVEYLSDMTFDPRFYIFANLITVTFTVFYFLFEEKLLSLLKEKRYFQKIQSLFI